MVRLKFIVLKDALVLRICEGYERYYKSVKNILINNPNVVRHWKADKERFFNFAASSKQQDFGRLQAKIQEGLCGASGVHTMHLRADTPVTM